MPFSGIVEPEQLAILTTLVDAYCKEPCDDPVQRGRLDCRRIGGGSARPTASGKKTLLFGAYPLFDLRTVHALGRFDLE